MANIWNNDELAILMKEFISLHGRTEIIVAKLADILLEYFENANSFERSREDIVKFIQLHLAEEDQKLLQEASALPRSKNNEQKRIARLALNLNAKVSSNLNLIYYP